METLKMHETFIHILKGNAITYSAERNVDGICSLSFFNLDHPDSTHPDHWEIHPDGDELLLVTSGKLVVEIVTQTYSGEDNVPNNPESKIATIRSGESLIVKKGHWHRVELKEKTDLVVAGFRGNTKLAPVQCDFSDAKLHV